MLRCNRPTAAAAWRSCHSVSSLQTSLRLSRECAAETVQKVDISFFAALAVCALSRQADAGIYDLSQPQPFDVGDYVQKGLMLHYDGIRNAGADRPHCGDSYPLTTSH